jgi:hypothetical protein
VRCELVKRDRVFAKFICGSLHGGNDLFFAFADVAAINALS